MYSTRISKQTFGKKCVRLTKYPKEGNQLTHVELGPNINFPSLQWLLELLEKLQLKKKKHIKVFLISFLQSFLKWLQDEQNTQT